MEMKTLEEKLDEARGRAASAFPKKKTMADPIGKKGSEARISSRGKVPETDEKKKSTQSIAWRRQNQKEEKRTALESGHHVGKSSCGLGENGGELAQGEGCPLEKKCASAGEKSEKRKRGDGFEVKGRS